MLQAFNHRIPCGRVVRPTVEKKDRTASTPAEFAKLNSQVLGFQMRHADSPSQVAIRGGIGKGPPPPLRLLDGRRCLAKFQRRFSTPDAEFAKLTDEGGKPLFSRQGNNALIEGIGDPGLFQERHC